MAQTQIPENSIGMRRSDFEAYALDHSYHDRTPVHFHIGFYELYIFRSGDVTYHIGQEQYTLTPGDMLLIPPGVAHWPVMHTPASRYQRIVLWINAQYLQSLCTQETDLCACFTAAPSGAMVHLSQNDLMKTVMWLDRIVQLDRTPGFGYDIERRALFSLLMLTVNEACPGPESMAAPAVRPDPRIHAVIEYVHAHIADETLSLQSIASLFYISPSMLAKAFQKEMGISLYQYIIKRRMFTAADLIAGGETPTHVSALVGYADYSAFYRAYRREFGQSPLKQNVFAAR